MGFSFNSIVKNSFKAIMISMIMFVIVGVTLYIGRMYAMRHKINGIMTNLSNSVSRNHYLSDSEYDMYKNLLNQVVNDDKSLIRGIEINYGSEAKPIPAIGFDIPANVDDYGKDLRKVSNVGDYKVIQIHVQVNRVVWGSEQSNGAIGNAMDIKTGWQYGDEYFNAVVPCLRYIK